MNEKLKSKIKESLDAVLPVTLIVLILDSIFVSLRLDAIVLFLVGTVMLIVGMGMFQLGAEMSMIPIGEGIGKKLYRSKNKSFLAITAFLIGMFITIAEPDLQVLSEQVPSIPNIVLILTVAIGVGIFFVIALLRIIKKISLRNLLLVFYAIVLCLSFFIPEEFLPVAFDSGGVTTGPMTVPFIMAFGVGFSSSRSDSSASDDSFGLTALCSIGPILAVMILGCFYQADAISYTAAQLQQMDTLQEVLASFASQLPKYAKEVGLSMLPIFMMYLIFQFRSHAFHGHKNIKIIVGFIYTYVGLVLFLCGVNVGFAPIGSELGYQLAASSYKWILVPVGMLIGYFIVRAEPAIQLLNKQVQEITNGTISESAMNLALSIGVSCSVGIAMLRILTGIPLQYIIIPGYIIALLMSRKVPGIFVGIAFDSGGVASGPMTSTFLLPLCIGACLGTGGNIMCDAFGVVSLVALAPVIAIQVMGLYYQHRIQKAERSFQREDNLLLEESDLIIEVEE